MKNSFQTILNHLVKERSLHVLVDKQRALRLQTMNTVIPLMEQAVALEIPGDEMNASSLQELRGEEVKILGNPTQELLLIHHDYPKSGSKQEKIKNVLRKQNRAMRIPEIQNIIGVIEGPDESKKTLKSFSYILALLQDSGEIIMGKKSNKYTFYILPNFLNEYGKLKPEHNPSPESWGNLKAGERDLSTIQWKGDHNS